MVMKRSGEGSTGKITTSKGNQLKMRVGDTWYKADYLGYEGAAEVAASCLLSQSNISEYVSYKLNKMWYLEKEYNACTSPHFLDNEEEIITADRLMQREISPKYIDTMRSMTLKDRIEFFVNSIAKITGISDFGVCLSELLGN